MGDQEVVGDQEGERWDGVEVEGVLKEGEGEEWALARSSSLLWPGKSP